MGDDLEDNEYFKTIDENDLAKYMIFTQYYFMSKHFNLDDAFKYEKISNNKFSFIDSNEYLNYVLIENSEFKHIFIIDNKEYPTKERKYYSDTFGFVLDTVIKIFKDELLAYFKNNESIKEIKYNSISNDESLYTFYYNIFKIFKEDWFEIIENKYINITLKKNGKN